MIAPPFVWGDRGEAMTPEQVQRRRDMAALLAQDSGSMSPVSHWTQAAARGLGGFLAGRSERIADRAEADGLASADAAVQQNPVLSALMGGDQMPVGNPAPVSAVASALAGLPDSIVQSESGGNWNALNSEGYGGRGQFGAERLSDAARAGVIPAGMTGADYSQAPEGVQLAVENWHRNDILNTLGKYVGVDVDGAGPIPPLTENSILAVAHLGGTGGARKFIESGGQYDPADSNGTSLSDYATRHAGGSGAAPGQSRSDVIAALIGSQSNPWVAQKYGGVMEALLDQEMGRQDAQYRQQLEQADPMYQAQLEGQRIQNEALRNPAVDPWEGIQEINGQLVQMGANGPEVIGDFRTAEPGFTTLPAEAAAQIGLDPSKVYQQGPDGRISEIGGGGVSVTNVMPGQDKFDEAFAKGDADALAAISDAGTLAQRNFARLEQLETLFDKAPSGMASAWKLRAGEWGINTDGLSEIQAAQALINTMVPEQRQPGSGPMSDADLALFKQSLPRIINQPGGNQLILDNIRAIARYDAEGAQIVQQLRAGQINRTQAFQMLQSRENPLAGFAAPSATSQTNTNAPDGIDSDLWEYMTPEERALFQ